MLTKSLSLTLRALIGAPAVSEGRTQTERHHAVSDLTNG